MPEYSVRTIKSDTVLDLGAKLETWINELANCGWRPAFITPVQPQSDSGTSPTQLIVTFQRVT